MTPVKSLSKASVDLDNARKLLDLMSPDHEVGLLEELWSEYLHCLARGFNKIQNVEKELGKKSKSLARANTLRNNDKLLAYLRQSRNTLEHRLEEVSGWKRVIEMEFETPTQIGGSEIIELPDGRLMAIVHDIYGNLVNNVKVVDSGLQIALRQVEDHKGKIHDIPDSHLGSQITDQSPQYLGNLGIDFYENLIRDIKAEFRLPD